MHLSLKAADAARYALWGGIVATAGANRRAYGMRTTWLPHLLANSVALLLPDAYRLLADRRPAQPDLAALHAALTRLVCGNRAYVAYVAPLALGYLTSHPRFNIYKGELAELKLAGFGLDAIPHGATAFALTALVCDALGELALERRGQGVGARLAGWGRDHSGLLSALALALATVVWEVGEHRIHRHELAQRGSAEAINMQWSAEDTLFDCLSNALGWALAVAVKRKT